MHLFRRLSVNHAVFVFDNGGPQVACGVKQSLLYASTCFEHYVLIIRRSKLYYTASGIITPVGDRPVHKLRVFSRPVHRTATYRV